MTHQLVTTQLLMNFNVILLYSVTECRVFVQCDLLLQDPVIVVQDHGYGLKCREARVILHQKFAGVPESLVIISFYTMPQFNVLVFSKILNNFSRMFEIVCFF